jgi:spore coat polysaccharide biosynthesis predicted glycosyltransferase SpsG
MPCADLRVLFAAAAGPRRGFGHLVRCRSLARAMGVRPLVAVRGGPQVTDAALVLGCDVVADADPAVVAKIQPDVLVVDDPIARAAARWVEAGRRAGCLVVSIHDLGLGCVDGDVVVDGSVAHNARASKGRTLAGTQYAVLDPGLIERRGLKAPPYKAGASALAVGRGLQAPPKNGNATRVLISLGGGPRAKRAAAIADAIASLIPNASIRIVGGFVPGLTERRGSRIAWVDAPRGLRDELARADVAVLGGGVSLYEACALGVPTVGVPVVKAQEPTVAAFVRKKAALGEARTNVAADSIAAHAARLAAEGTLRRRISRTARSVVDGRGARRVAAAVAKLHHGRTISAHNE